MASDLPLINIPDAAIEAGAHAMAESVALDPTELGAFNLAHVCLEAAAPFMGAGTQAARDVLSERRRQVEAEGWTPEHDDTHDRGELPRAALSYLSAVIVALSVGSPVWSSPPPVDDLFPGSSLVWPWARRWWKPGSIRRMLVKAAALIIAEIERLDRLPPPLPQEER